MAGFKFEYFNFHKTTSKVIIPIKLAQFCRFAYKFERFEPVWNKRRGMPVCVCAVCLWNADSKRVHTLKSEIYCRIEFRAWSIHSASLFWPQSMTNTHTIVATTIYWLNKYTRIKCIGPIILNGKWLKPHNGQTILSMNFEKSTVQPMLNHCDENSQRLMNWCACVFIWMRYRLL